MAETRGEGQQAEIVPTVAPELEQGVYANYLGVQVTPWDYVLTFHQLLPPRPDEPGRLEAKAVARIVIPAGLMSAVIDALQRVHGQRDQLEQVRTEGSEG